MSAAKLAGLVSVTSLSTPASDDEKATVFEYLTKARTDLPSTAEAIIQDLEFAEVYGPSIGARDWQYFEPIQQHRGCI